MQVCFFSVFRDCRSAIPLGIPPCCRVELLHIKETLQPIDILREKLSRKTIIERQKAELSEIYTNCLASENFEYIPKQDPKDPFELKYKLVSNLLFIYKVHYRIYIQPTPIRGSEGHVLPPRPLVREWLAPWLLRPTKVRFPHAYVTLRGWSAGLLSTSAPSSAHI